MLIACFSFFFLTSFSKPCHYFTAIIRSKLGSNAVCKILSINHFIAIQLKKQMDPFCKLSTDQLRKMHCYVSVITKAKSQILWWKFGSAVSLTGVLEQPTCIKRLLASIWEKTVWQSNTTEERAVAGGRMFCFCKHAASMHCNIAISELGFFLHINCPAYFHAMKV